jgi:hypothetical protein
MQLTDTDLDLILTTLAGKTLSTEQYVKLNKALANIAERKRNVAKYSLSRGQKVKWSSRGMYPRTGRIVKIMRKNADVTADDDGLRWRVPLSILESA